jgi:4-amino-4-deoxy-L-arabinose transferase-like glycosyltransferase
LQVVVGSLSLLLFYSILKRIHVRTALIGTSLLAVFPWHLMMSRWGLESNLFPTIILAAVWCFLRALESKKGALWQFSLLLGLSLYAYGAAYVFVPLFCFILVVSYRKRFSVQQITISTSLFSVLALPMAWFIASNEWHINGGDLGFISFPTMYAMRYSEVTGSDPISLVTTAILILLTQNDHLLHNSFSYLGFFASPFLIFGFFLMIKKAREHHVFSLFAAMVFSSTPLLFVVAPNLNRINIFLYPVVFFITITLSHIMKYRLNLAISSLTLLFSIYSISAVSYFTSYQKLASDTFFESLPEAISFAYAIKKKDETIFIDQNDGNQPYIFALFVTKYPASKYVQSGSPAGFGDFIFTKPLENSLIIQPNAAITFDDQVLKTFKNFSVIRHKKISP